MKKIYRVLEIIGCIFVIVAIVVIAGNVFKRWIFGTPLHGAYELAGLCACMFVSVCIPMAVVTDGHTSVEILYKRFGIRGRTVLSYFGAVVDVIAAGLTSFASYKLGMVMLKMAETTDSLHIPRWPFRFLWAVCMTLFVVFTIAKMVDIPKKVKEEKPLKKDELPEVETGGID